MTTTTRILAAKTLQTRDVAHVIASAFEPLDAAQWLVPGTGPWTRTCVLQRQFEILVQHAQHHGQVFTTPGMEAAAVLFPRGPQPAPAPEDYDQRLEDACGQHTYRFRALDQLFDAHHPADTEHWHLALLAVSPRLQGQGLGTELLSHCHRTLGGPFYLEASSPRAQALYERHGYRKLQRISIAGGPSFTTMWAGGTSHDGGGSR